MKIITNLIQWIKRGFQKPLSIDKDHIDKVNKHFNRLPNEAARLHYADQMLQLNFPAVRGKIVENGYTAKQFYQQMQVLMNNTEKEAKK